MFNLLILIKNGTQQKRSSLPTTKNYKTSSTVSCTIDCYNFVDQN